MVPDIFEQLVGLKELVETEAGASSAVEEFMLLDELRATLTEAEQRLYTYLRKTGYFQEDTSETASNGPER